MWMKAKVLLFVLLSLMTLLSDSKKGLGVHRRLFGRAASLEHYRFPVLAVNVAHSV